MKYAVIVTYSGGETTGAVITASSQEDAWERVMELFGCGKNIRGVQMACILTPERGDKGGEVKVIIKSGIVSSVLSDGNPNVEIVDIDSDYEDYDALSQYEKTLYERQDLAEKEFTVAHFTEEEEAE